MSLAHSSDLKAECKQKKLEIKITFMGFLVLGNVGWNFFILFLLIYGKNLIFVTE